MRLSDLPTPQVVVDRGRLGLFFDARPAAQPVSDVVIEAAATALPNTESTRVRACYYIANIISATTAGRSMYW